MKELQEFLNSDVAKSADKTTQEAVNYAVSHNIGNSASVNKVQVISGTVTEVTPDADDDLGRYVQIKIVFKRNNPDFALLRVRSKKGMEFALNVNLGQTVYAEGHIRYDRDLRIGYVDARRVSILPVDGEWIDVMSTLDEVSR